MFCVACRAFLVLEKRGRSSTCVTTHELNALNSRLRDAAADCIMLTVQVGVEVPLSLLCGGGGVRILIVKLF